MHKTNPWRFCVIILLNIFLMLQFNFLQAEAGSSVLKQGMSGEDVVKLQIKLQEYGYYQGEIDGNFGAVTKLALIDFQADCNLEADGIAGVHTMEFLRNFRSQEVVNRGSEGKKGGQLANFARQFLGVPYVWSGQSSLGFDCSGFIYYVFKNFGISLPRMADEQFEMGLGISFEDLQPGDLVFFSTYEPGASHVGIYIGQGQFIHASSGADAVVITPIRKSYYAERYIGARRIIK